MAAPTSRLASIDSFRALTMFLMIFVNDLWTLKDIPAWLEHTQAREDGMGLADTVFPAFLFIVGLSIPFAIGNRLQKQHSQKSILVHILFRGIALLVMGFFHVNLESYATTGALLPKPVWQILLTVSFFLIWLDYARDMSKLKKGGFQSTGIVLLVFLAIVYRGENGEWMRPQWWGILGLIGWSYLLCAILFLVTRGQLAATISALLFFLLFNIAAQAGWLSFLAPIKKYVWIVGDGSMPALVMAGVLAAQWYSAAKNIFLTLILAAIAFATAGLLLRPYFIISKILATPSWVMICTALSMAMFAVLIYIVDIKKKQQWFSIIKPAGTSTLTAYLLPYIHYAVYSIAGISLPLMWRTGIAGIVKSLIYAMLIILITGLLEKWKLRLKI